MSGIARKMLMARAGVPSGPVAPAYDIANATYDSVSFNFSSQGGTGRALRFNNDGTKMYYLSDGNNSIYQYSLSTAFDVSTTTYDSVSFDVSTQETSPSHFNFNSDGSKIYVMGFNTDSIYQYSLSTAFDISSASYDSVSFSVGSQETDPFGFCFNDDGTKIYVIGNTNDRVYQYSLSTPFDLNTASYDSVSFSVSAQETGPTDIAFNADGRKMYITGFIQDSVFQYSLSSPFNVNTASYDSVSFSASSQVSTSFSLFFNPAGTKMYILDGGGATPIVFQYSLPSP